VTTREVAASHSRHATRAAVASLALAVLLLIGKAWAAWETDSTAMLASLADTALDVIASLTTLAGIRIAAIPADHDHRFGHGKAEALVALAQVGLITFSGRDRRDAGTAVVPARGDRPDRIGRDQDRQRPL
jgi:ferrous-iron efflux pump FieF